MGVPEGDNIVLVGMRASGKTRLGSALAQRLGRPFVDLDDEIARRAGRDVDALLSEDGEARFRAVEAEVLDWAASLRGTVVATGGGAVLHGERFSGLSTTGTVVYLQVPLDELVRRSAERPRPPLTALDPEGEVAALLQEREPLYRSVADITIPATGPDPILGLLQHLSCGPLHED